MDEICQSGSMLSVTDGTNFQCSVLLQSNISKTAQKNDLYHNSASCQINVSIIKSQGFAIGRKPLCNKKQLRRTKLNMQIKLIKRKRFFTLKFCAFLYDCFFYIDPKIFEYVHANLQPTVPIHLLLTHTPTAGAN